MLIFYLFLNLDNNHRLRSLLTPGTVKLREPPQQSWRFTDEYYTTLPYLGIYFFLAVYLK